MNNTWFAQLVVAFILAAVVGLYIVPRTLSAEEMSQIAGACSPCERHDIVFCAANSGHPLNTCYRHKDRQKTMCRKHSPGSNKYCLKAPGACDGDGCIPGQKYEWCSKL